MGRDRNRGPCVGVAIFFFFYDGLSSLSLTQITGNKMTSLNLATIFGPNLLHKLKSSDKEFSVQSSARAEESTAVIAVLQRMIASYQTLFLVSVQ